MIEAAAGLAKARCVKHRMLSAKIIHAENRRTQQFPWTRILIGWRNKSVAPCMKPITLKFENIEIMLSVCWLTTYLSPLKTGTYYVVPKVKYRRQHPAVTSIF
jgi:hypothetical protein